jgi:hypothetical protein
VVELGANAARVLDAVGPSDRHALPSATEVRRHLLGPFERRVERPGPRHRHVWVGRSGAPCVVSLHLFGNGKIEDAVVRGHLIEGAARGAFGAGAIVAADVDDERVVELAHVFDGLNHPADLVVGVGCVGSKHFCLACIQLLLLGGERLPLFQVIRPRGEFRIRRDHAETLLVGEDLFAHGVPAMSNDAGSEARAELTREWVEGQVIYRLRALTTAPAPTGSGLYSRSDTR